MQNEQRQSGQSFFRRGHGNTIENCTRVIIMVSQHPEFYQAEIWHQAFIPTPKQNIFISSENTLQEHCSFPKSQSYREIHGRNANQSELFVQPNPRPYLLSPILADKHLSRGALNNSLPSLHMYDLLIKVTLSQQRRQLYKLESQYSLET